MNDVKKNPDKMTLAEHAEAWWKENGNMVPPKDTLEYENMYEKWHEFAFQNFTPKKS